MLRRKTKETTSADSAEIEINGVKVKIMGPATRWAIIAIAVIFYLNQ